MVYLHADPLDRTFAALADPTRRALLARLSDDESVTVSELARPLPMSLPAVMKHLDVLAQAGVISRAQNRPPLPSPVRGRAPGGGQRPPRRPPPLLVPA